MLRGSVDEKVYEVGIREGQPFIGKAVIFSFENFPSSDAHKLRSGADNDRKRLENVFKKAGLLTECYLDMTKSDMSTKITEIAFDDRNNNFDLFVCVVLSHGTEGTIFFTHDSSPVCIKEDVVNAFERGVFRHKTKIFIANFCRNIPAAQSRVNASASHMFSQMQPKPLQHTVSDEGVIHSVHGQKKVDLKNTLLVFSTLPGTESLRCDKNGSIFIQNFVNLLEENTGYYVFKWMCADIVTIIDNTNVGIFDQLQKVREQKELRQEQRQQEREKKEQSAVEEATEANMVMDVDNHGHRKLQVSTIGSVAVSRAVSGSSDASGSETIIAAAEQLHHQDHQSLSDLQQQSEEQEEEEEEVQLEQAIHVEKFSLTGKIYLFPTVNKDMQDWLEEAIRTAIEKNLEEYSQCSQCSQYSQCSQELLLAMVPVLAKTLFMSDMTTLDALANKHDRVFRKVTALYRLDLQRGADYTDKKGKKFRSLTERDYELLHAILCGKVLVQSPFGFRYCLRFLHKREKHEQVALVRQAEQYVRSYCQARQLADVSPAVSLLMSDLFACRVADSAVLIYPFRLIGGDTITASTVPVLPADWSKRLSEYRNNLRNYKVDWRYRILVLTLFRFCCEYSDFNNVIYNGDIAVVDGHPLNHGQGYAIYPGRATYVGSWRNNKRDGFGTYAGVHRYTGEWKDDLIHGKGVMHYASGGIYDGEWAKNAMHGQGTMLYNQGAKYTGQWWRDQKDGFGVEHVPNDDDICDVFTGLWVENKRVFGRCEYVNGDIYIGRWDGDLRSGRGEMRYTDESVFRGTWVADKKHGSGMLRNVGRTEKVKQEWDLNALISSVAVSLTATITSISEIPLPILSQQQQEGQSTVQQEENEYNVKRMRIG